MYSHDFRDHSYRGFPDRSAHIMPEMPFSSHGPMPIPSRTAMNTAPPPLPPPPRIHDLDNGYDAGWLHANSEKPSHLAPINPNSSLFGGHRRAESVLQSDRMAVDDDFEGRQSGVPVSRSPEAQIMIAPPPPADEGFPNSVSVNQSGPVLKGERNFSLRSVQDSSNAYDQHLLSKIGKPLSPRGSISQGTENRGSVPALTVPSRTTSNIPSPGPSESSTLDVKWHNSPQSGGVSPRTKVGWRREYIDGRSPSLESILPSAALDYDHHGYRRRYGGTTPQREDSISLPSRSNRGSYDQGVFSDLEGEFSTDEPAAPRQFVIREPTPPYAETSKQGMKRRASSPPREPMTDDRHPTLRVTMSSSDLSQRRKSGQPFSNTLSVNNSYAPSHRTLSAGSSLSIHTSGSYSSTLSIGNSSMTSLSPYDRPSPGGLSPSSDLDTFHEKSIMNPSASAGAPLIHPAVSRGISGSNSLEPPITDTTGKIPMPANLNISKGASSKMSGLYICDCCPKKPKKFDNPDDLRVHEMEKQYSCQYCNNRFKNKNEAERHQNSLHLRPHSWSCAALPNYQSAFHGSAAPSAQTTAGPSHDTCGYCGEEFPNFPQPDWDRRFEHLTTVHKYGECNNAKKFFRADHFRQHLKHSHAGSSGKWTNILENACMKEEQLPEPRKDKALHSASGSGSATQPSAGSLTSNTIDEVLSER
ncbi:hypothetical protein N7474_008514 [Penicillium riverlandense]|uniref:uncharacterized protein n=1 Tax=Penicillium riverlandense TaxID=1903569 RepID=UPI0025473FD4|nr:uncharacterized protein N7474_008514 [Penicillium riverlandense]KAJ5812213.1 hypothetical protein N7474_008514 [Penicillium riverlandense]